MAHFELLLRRARSAYAAVAVLVLVGHLRRLGDRPYGLDVLLGVAVQPVHGGRRTVSGGFYAQARRVIAFAIFMSITSE